MVSAFMNHKDKLQYCVQLKLKKVMVGQKETDIMNAPWISDPDVGRIKSNNWGQDFGKADIRVALILAMKGWESDIRKEVKNSWI